MRRFIFQMVPIIFALILCLPITSASIGHANGADAMQLHSAVSLQSVNFPDRYLVAKVDGSAIEVLPVPADSAEELKERAVFSLLPGLSDGTLVSLQVSDASGRYVVATSSGVTLQSLGDISTTSEATFRKAAGLAGSGVSFESVSQPDHYLRHSGFVLRLDPFADTPLYREDASFMEVDPLGSGGDNGEATTTNTPAPTSTPTATPADTPEPTATSTNSPEPPATSTDSPEPTATSTNSPEPPAAEGNAEAAFVYIPIVQKPIPIIQGRALPIPSGSSIEQGENYVSPSGGHYLTFQEDGNLAVFTASGQLVWDISQFTDNFSNARQVQIIQGNLWLTGPNNEVYWSTSNEDQDARAYLNLSRDGALQLASDGGGVLWSSDDNLTAVDNGTDCDPFDGWAKCQMLTDPKIRINGTSRVSQSAMDHVAQIYTDMTALFNPAYPKNRLDGYVVYITNGEPWPELIDVHPVGPMWDDGNGNNRGDDLRGGASTHFLWISEQMICKRGIATREDDDTERTFDQVVHEFGHTIDMNYGLRDRILQEYAGGWSPVEQFPWSIQHWFGVPNGDLRPNESAFIGEIFSGTTTFSCDGYTP